jgi:hypothetical protein
LCPCNGIEFRNGVVSESKFNDEQGDMEVFLFNCSKKGFWIGVLLWVGKCNTIGFWNGALTEGQNCHSQNSEWERGQICSKNGIWNGVLTERLNLLAHPKTFKEGLNTMKKARQVCQPD